MMSRGLTMPLLPGGAAGLAPAGAAPTDALAPIAEAADGALPMGALGPPPSSSSSSSSSSYNNYYQMFMKAVHAGGLHGGIFREEVTLALLRCMERAAQECLALVDQALARAGFTAGRLYHEALARALDQALVNPSGATVEEQVERIVETNARAGDALFRGVCLLYVRDVHGEGLREGERMSVRMPAFRDFVAAFFRALASDPYVRSGAYFDASRLAERKLVHADAMRSALDQCMRGRVTVVAAPAHAPTPSSSYSSSSAPSSSSSSSSTPSASSFSAGAAQGSPRSSTASATTSSSSSSSSSSSVSSTPSSSSSAQPSSSAATTPAPSARPAPPSLAHAPAPPSPPPPAAPSGPPRGAAADDVSDPRARRASARPPPVPAYRVEPPPRPRSALPAHREHVDADMMRAASNSSRAVLPMADDHPAEASGWPPQTAHRDLGADGVGRAMDARLRHPTVSGGSSGGPPSGPMQWPDRHAHALAPAWPDEGVRGRVAPPEGDDGDPVPEPTHPGRVPAAGPTAERSTEPPLPVRFPWPDPHQPWGDPQADRRAHHRQGPDRPHHDPYGPPMHHQQQQQQFPPYRAQPASYRDAPEPPRAAGGRRTTVRLVGATPPTGAHDQDAGRPGGFGPYGGGGGYGHIRDDRYPDGDGRNGEDEEDTDAADRTDSW
jgi:hypothetical protein